jgi:hypothetical protein
MAQFLARDKRCTPLAWMMLPPVFNCVPNPVQNRVLSVGHFNRAQMVNFSLAPGVRALWTIKYCAMTLVAFIVGAEAYFFIFHRGKDDIAGGVALGLFLIFVSAVIAIAAAVFERLLQSAVDMKSENDLTV